MAYFQGARYQRGSGLGSVLGGLVRSAVPMIKPVLKTMGREALKGGVNVLNDVLRGDNLQRAAKRRLLEGSGRVLKMARGRVAPTTTTKKKKPAIKRRRKAGKASDIFR